MRVATVVVAAGMFVTTVALAQDHLFPNFFEQGKSGFLHGQDGNSCGSFIENKQAPTLRNSIHFQDMAWALGYLEGIDVTNPYDIKAYDYAGLNLWLEQYFRRNPINLLVNATHQFYFFIGGRLPITKDVGIWRRFPVTEQHEQYRHR